jgi:hypothetical protein
MMTSKTFPDTAQEAYNIVSIHLAKFAKDCDTPDDAYDLFAIYFEARLGKYAGSLDLLIRAYYNIEDFVQDGEPMENFYRYVDSVRS